MVVGWVTVVGAGGAPVGDAAYVGPRVVVVVLVAVTAGLVVYVVTTVVCATVTVSLIRGDTGTGCGDCCLTIGDGDDGDDVQGGVV